MPVRAPNLSLLDMYEANAPDLSPLFGMPSLGYVNVDRSPVSQADIDTLVNVYGVFVDGTPLSGTPLSEIVFNDPELEQCIYDNYPGIVNFLYAKHEVDCPEGFRKAQGGYVSDSVRGSNSEVIISFSDFF